MTTLIANLGAAEFTLILGNFALIALWLWAVVDAALMPNESYAAAGLNKALVIALVLVTCVLGALIYALLLRRRLRRAG